MSQVMSKIKQFASRLNNSLCKPGESTSSRPGWMVRDSHLTIGGLRMTNTTAGTFTRLISLLTIPAFFITTFLLSSNNTYADGITISISGTPTITVAPMPEGTFADSGNININVTSTAASGYTLAITGGGSTSLTGTTDNTKSITSISSAIDQNTFSTNTSYNNMWGYKPSKHYDSSTESVVDNSNYLPSPTSNGDIIDMVSDSSSNDYTMSIGARVTNTLGFQSYENNTFVIAAVGNSKCNRAATSIDDAICMQDMNDSVINSMTMNQQYQLIDERDNKTYYIAKMKDGRVWMTQNLDLDLSTSKPLTSDNTNLTTFGSQNYTTDKGYSCSNADTTTNCTASDETITWVPASTTLAKSAASSWSNQSYTPYSYDYEDYYYYTNTSGTNTAYDTESACTSAHNDGTCPHYHVGNYYNFTAAVASNSTSGITANYTVMGNSICPAGWRLPNGVTSSTSSNVGYYGEANYTWRAQGIINSYVGYASSASYNTNGYLNISNNPLYLARSGYKNGTSVPSYMGSNNYYQTNTIYSSSNSYTSYFYSSYAYPGYYYGYRYNGYPIRCITMLSSNTGTTTITFNKNASDATGAMSSQTYNANTLNILPSNGFSRSGYEFKNWNTQADGSGTSYANAAQYYAAAGTSTNNVTLYAQWVKTYDVKVNFAGSGVSSVSFTASGYTTRTVSTSGGTASLAQGVRYTTRMSFSDGYKFGNWSLNSSSYGTLSSTSTNPTYFTPNTSSGSAIITATGKPPTTFDLAFANAGKSKQGGYYKMQDISSSICSAVDQEQIGQLIDTRDSNVYYVGKLKDNRCWMLDNLRLGSTSTIALTTANTNITRSWTLPAGVTSNFSSLTASRINVAYKNNTVTNYGSGSGKIGVYYNYCAASAGTICGNTIRSDATEDICPTGWRMPTNDTDDTDGEYRTLYHAYSSTSTKFTKALSATLSGNFYDSTQGSLNLGGYFWSSTWDGSNYMYNLRVTGSNSINIQRSGDRYQGYSIRCITK